MFRVKTFCGCISLESFGRFYAGSFVVVGIIAFISSIIGIFYGGIVYGEFNFTFSIASFIYFIFILGASQPFTMTMVMAMCASICILIPSSKFLTGIDDVSC